MLGLSNALEFLCRPLQIWLENGGNDRNFLLAFANIQQRKELETAQKCGWLQFSNAGGCGMIKTLSQHLGVLGKDRLTPSLQLRMMLVMDSDRTTKDEPNDAVEVREQLQLATQAFGLEDGSLGFVLRRREAENYIPPGAFLEWAKTNRTNERDRVLRAARAWNRVDSSLREVIDLKNGAPCQGKLRTNQEIWDQLKPFNKKGLLTGIGSKAGSKFFEESIALDDESGEIQSILQQILRRL